MGGGLRLFEIGLQGSTQLFEVLPPVVERQLGSCRSAACPLAGLL